MIEVQNLRNKYKDHPVIRPLIIYCEDKNLGFELIKDSRLIRSGLKGIQYENCYYMTIGNRLLETDAQATKWRDLFTLLIEAYNHLGLEYPEPITKAAKSFKRKL